MSRSIFAVVLIMALFILPMGCGQQESASPPQAEEAVTMPEVSDIEAVEEAAEEAMEKAGAEAEAMEGSAMKAMEDAEAEAEAVEGSEVK